MAADDSLMPLNQTDGTAALAPPNKWSNQSPLEHARNTNVGLPDNIYGITMAQYVHSLVEPQSSRVHTMTAMCCLFLVGNIIFQFCMMHYIDFFLVMPAIVSVRTTYDDFHSTVFPGNVFSQEGWDSFDAGEKKGLCEVPLSQPKFFLAVLFIWTMAVAIEIKTTLLRINWWFQLPRCDIGHVTTEVSEDDSEVVIQKASLSLKLLILCTISLPKLIVAALLWLVGARWLTATTSFSDLILNAMALTFVVDVDEMIYTVCVPVFMAADTARVKLSVAGPVGDKNMRLVKNISQSLVKCLLVLGIPLSYLLYFQQVLPGFTFDIHSHCKELLLKEYSKPLMD